jgi:indolepyruvate ferredoxin oxidoreductase
MAAHLEGKGASEMQMAGLAQKGGAVTIHTRIAPRPQDITSVRVAAGEADAVIGGDLVVTAAPKTMQAMERGRTRVLCNLAEIVTGEFTLDPEFRLPGKSLRLQIERRVGDGALTMVDAQHLAERMLGDAIYANVLLLGAAWQAGMIPLSEAAIAKAIELNGAGVEGNLRAFTIGRWAVAFPDAARASLDGAVERPETVEEKIARRAEFLVGYQSARLKKRYLALVEEARAAEEKAGVVGFAEAVAEGYFKLLAYKDEYEVARLHAETLEGELAEAFDGVKRVTFHMAPPIFGRKDKEGRPVKSEFGPWMLKALRLLRRGKALRGTPLDPFGYTAERRMERRMIREYRKLATELMAGLTPASAPVAIELARLPLKIRGFGHVKEAAARRAAEEREALLAQFRSGGPAPMAQAAE